MNLEHYKNFVAIADIGTISGAAEKLLIAQPALSSQVKALEHKYGAQLLIRNPRHVELTDAGKILYDRIKSICALEDAAQKEINACIVGNRGTLRLATTAIHPDPPFYQLLQDFHMRYPEISFDIHERNSAQIAELLLTNVVEIGLMRIHRPDLRRVLTIQEHMMVYYHRDHSILHPQLEAVPLSLLRGMPLTITSGMKQQFTTACQNEDFDPSYVCVSSSRAMATLWAKDEKTACIIAGSSNYDDGDYCCRILSSDILETCRSLTVAKGRRLSAVANTFLDFCCSHPLAEGWITEKKGS